MLNHLFDFAKVYFKESITEFLKKSCSSHVDGDIERLFTVHGHGDALVVVFDVTLRPHLPLLDLLYIERLRRLLAEDERRRAVIALWTLRNDNSAEKAEKYVERLKEYMGSDVEKRCAFLIVEMPEEGVLVDIVSLDTLQKVSSEDFLKEQSKNLEVRVKTFHDLHPGRSTGVAIREMMVHVIRSGMIADHLLGKNGSSEAPVLYAESVRDIGLIIWELELDKLSLVERLETSERGKHTKVFSGQTIKYRSGLKCKLLPAKDDAFGILHDSDRRTKAMELLPKAAVRTYTEVCETILRSRGTTDALIGVGRLPQTELAGDVRTLERHIQTILRYLRMSESS